jgi:hypothetical protein
LHNPALANALVDFFAQNLVDQVVEILVVREDDVTALVPHEAVLIDMRSGVAADVAGLSRTVPNCHSPVRANGRPHPVRSVLLR